MRTFTPGQQIEALMQDFSTPGFPEVWVPADVVDVTPLDGGLHDVFVSTHLGRKMFCTGKRGGNRHLRSA